MNGQWSLETAKFTGLRDEARLWPKDNPADESPGQWVVRRPATNRSGCERLRPAPWLNDAMRDTAAKVVLALLTKQGSEVSWRARSASGRTERPAERYISTAARYQIQ